MPRMTRKYVAAIETAHSAGLAQPGGWAENQAQVYQALNEAGYHWDSDAGEWQKWADQPADPPTEFIMIRCWASAEVIPELVEEVVHSLHSAGLRLMEQSPAYPCRPPKQQESRVYLKFLPERKFKLGS